MRRGAITVPIADQQDHVTVDRRLLRRAVGSVLRMAGVGTAAISVAIVDDDTISKLNWKYLRHRGPADVLSFPLDERDGLEGEVIVSAETAAPPRTALRLDAARRVAALRRSWHTAPGGPRRPHAAATGRDAAQRTGSIRRSWNREKMTLLWSAKACLRFFIMAGSMSGFPTNKTGTRFERRRRAVAVQR